MSTARLTQSVNDARVTLQRLADAKIVHGWVITFDGDWLNVRLSTELTQKSDPRFSCRIFREGGDITFMATLQSGADSIYHFRLESGFSILEPAGDARYARHMTAMANGLPVQVCDVSCQGIGFVSIRPLRTGDTVTVEIGGMTAVGQVRFCRAQRGEGAGHRIGLRLNEMDRIDRARWLEIVHAAPDTGTPPSRLAA